MKLRLIDASLLLLLFGLAACGDDSPPTPDAPPSDAAVDGATDQPDSGPDAAPLTSLEITGPVVGVGGATPPAEGKVIVLWRAPQEPMSYLSGTGVSNGSSYSVTLTAPPPPDASFGGQFGYAFIFLVDPALEIPDEGLVDSDTIREAALGLAGRHPVIWRNGPAWPTDWSIPFPQGYACGGCVDGDGENAFDDPTPIECTGIEIQVGPWDEIEKCNID
jgi:hypothetical protein